jgi:hypothetical protein
MAGEKPGTLRETEEEKMNTDPIDVLSLADPLYRLKLLLGTIRQHHKLTDADKEFHFDVSISELTRIAPPYPTEFQEWIKKLAYAMRGEVVPEDGAMKEIKKFCAEHGFDFEIIESTDVFRFYRRYVRPLPLSRDARHWNEGFSP